MERNLLEREISSVLNGNAAQFGEGEVERAIFNLSGFITGHQENELWWSQLWAPINLGKLIPKMISPVHHPVISSEFGPRKRPKPGGSTSHRGIDIVDADRDKTLGKDVVAPVNGIITRIVKNMDSKTGNFIEIKDTEGYLHKFMHLNDRNLGNGFPEGKKVYIGQKIAEIGGSGIARKDGYHLHYEIWKNGKSLDPRVVNQGLKNALTTKEARSGKSSNAISSSTIPAKPQLDTEKSYRDNLHFAQTLGWKEHLDKITTQISMPIVFKKLDVLHKNNQPLLAYYVANWQQKNGFVAKDVDGVIGPKTWKKMKEILGIAGM